MIDEYSQIIRTILDMEYVKVYLLGVITTIIAAISIIYIIKTASKEKKKEKLVQRDLFKDGQWIHSTNLNYTDLDYVRQKAEEQNPSSQIGIPEKILDILDRRQETEMQNHILLVAPSGSGKTHMSTSVLNKLKDAYVLLPNEKTFLQASHDNYIIPNIPKNAQYKILLLDNFHEYFKGGTNSPKYLIHKAIEKGVTVWANCISIEEYERVTEMLDFKDSHLGIFKEIKLDKKIDKSEAIDIASRLGKPQPLDTFNGLIGEIIYPPAAAIQHYNELKNGSVVTKDIMLFIKQAYMLGAFTLPYSMSIETIKKAYLKKYSDGILPLIDSLNIIERKGFIKLSNDHTTFSFESVWFNKIVEPNMKAIDFVEFWDEILPLNIVTFTNLMVASKEYEAAIQIFQEIISKKITPNERVFNVLINKSPDYKTALEWYKRIQDGEADLYTFSSLIKKSPDYKTALEWYKRIQDGEANVITYSSLIKISPNYKTALEWYEKIKPDEVNVYIYNSLIKMSPNYKTALEWYTKIEDKEVNLYTFNSLIKKSPDYDTALEWYKRIENGEADLYTYNSIIDKCCDIESALKWLKVIKEDSNFSVKTGSFTYGVLINAIGRTNHIDKYQMAISFHDEMIDKGIKPNVKLYTNLIKLAPSFDHGFRLMKLMITQENEENNKILPNLITRETMIRKAARNPILLKKLDNFFEENGISFD